MKNIAVVFFLRAIDWVFRPSTIAAQFIRAGVSIMLGALGVDWVVKGIILTSAGAMDLDVSTGNGLPGYMVKTAFWFACLLLVIGAVLALRDELRERRKLLIVVEARGLHSSPDTPAKKSIKRRFRGQRHEILVDFRPRTSSELVDPTLMLNQIEGMHLNLQSAAMGRDKSDVLVAAGGLAAVPAMFLMGAVLEDESNIEVFDWDRDIKDWRLLEGADDSVRFKPLARIFRQEKESAQY